MYQVYLHIRMNKKLFNKLLNIIYLLIFSLTTFSQRTITGIVLNKKNNEPIPLATVGLMEQNNGTYSDEKGIFNITSTYFKEDSLIISFVGYKTVVLSTSNFINNSFIKLELEERILDNVLIINRRDKKYQQINSFNNCSQNFFYLSFKSVTIIAQLYEAPQKGMLLSELEICKMSGNAMFRVHIFDFDSIKNCPSLELTDTLIVINSNKRNIGLNVENYNIIIPNKQFYIAIEWLKIPSNAYTKTIKFGGVKNIITMYEPGISFRYTDNKIGVKKLWNLSFNSKWQEQELNSNINLLISAKLK
jgi:CarboxypepD_reg-like domain